jgi:hypothetical protein
MQTRRKLPSSRLAFPGLYAGISLWDSLQNLRYTWGERRFLVVHHPSKGPFMHDTLLSWLAACYPEVRALFELHLLPCHVRDWSRYALHVPWLQDPVQAWSKTTYWLARRLAAACDRHGVPIVNRVERLGNAGKSTGARLIGSTGFRTPRMALIEDLEEFHQTHLGIPLPLFVREDEGHGGPMLRADTEDEVQALPLGSLRRPVAVELIDVRSPGDGLYRKYRYVVAGDIGVRFSLHITQDWVAHRRNIVFNEALREEEVAFLRGAEPEHARFLAARRALGLDFVAFDYSLDHAGRTVVWEANPFPFIHFIGGRRRYRLTATERVLAAMVKLYLTRAGMDVPMDFEEILGG